MHGFGLTIEELDAGAVRIALRGELDLAHAYTFDEELRRVEEARPSCVVLDLRELTSSTRAGSPACSPPAGAPARPGTGCCWCAARRRSSACSRCRRWTRRSRWSRDVPRRRSAHGSQRSPAGVTTSSCV